MLTQLSAEWMKVIVHIELIHKLSDPLDLGLSWNNWARH